VEVRKLEENNYNIVSGFNMRLKSISKSKYMFICKTDKGMFYLREVNLKADRIEFIHNIKENLADKGFTNINRFCISSLNKPYYIYNQKIYIMTKYIDYIESDFKNIECAEAISSELARFHSIAIAKPYYIGIDIKTDFQKKFDRLKKIKKFINNQSRLTDFDVLFIKNYTYFYNQALEAIEILNNSNYDYLKSEAVKNGYVCHNCIKEENFVVKDNKIHIIGFNDCCVDLPIVDLSEFIKRYIRKHGDNYIKLNSLLDCYIKNKGLTNDEQEVLKAILKFPDKYIKLCDGVYTKRKSLITNSIKNRVNEIIENKEHFKEYIKYLK